ncbi:uncharacterized protein N7459_006832 [Penicillium hispanicum]|uniref:uncharacterized protein n=1 Tax=Penicillium hispanicum TaxID=1080232 RepID=UPI002541E407|nr:uncharacterized protein N7459_006832 [Penicillium hispanicum]KAJ5577868.1 hypothetical protein N7459_006832 [Penicillium hispanicum]
MSEDFGDLVRWRHAHPVGSAIPASDILTDHICSLMSIPSSDEWEWFLNPNLRYHSKSEDPQPGLPEEEETIAEKAEVETKAAETDRSPPTPAAPALSRLQLLPGEIRQKIFGYVLDGYRLLIHKRRFSTILYPSGLRNYGRLTFHRRLSYRLLAPREMKTQELVEPYVYDLLAMSPPPLGLMLSCKSIYQDTLCYFYANTHFVFTSAKGIHAFLNSINPRAREVIRFVEIDCIEYKMPHRPRHIIWKKKSDEAWLRALTRISDELPFMKVLHLRVTIFSDPLEEAWGIVNPGLFPYLDAMNNLERLHWMKAILTIGHAGYIVPTNRNTFLRAWQPQYFAVCNMMAQLSRKYRERLQVQGTNETQPRWMPKPQFEAFMFY